MNDVIHNIIFGLCLFHLETVNYKHNQEFVKAFGEHLRKLRLQHGHSMRSFAILADIEYKQLSLIEHGSINTTISTVNALADALDLPVKELFDFKVPAKSK
ncbi:MAG: XRE family transcriptional regulator [Sphingobacteriales bacterium]|nr:MAG: XRE family transcriptional regulator [Sphingobacteriales bacterium]